MALSKREQYIGVITGVVLGGIVLYHFVIDPLIAQQAELSAKISMSGAELEKANRLFTRSREARRGWATMSGTSLRKDASEAESQVLNNVREWAQDAGMSLSSIKPERTGEKEKDFYKSTFRATGGGSMAQVGRFLYRIQTATVPVRITDLTINSRKEGTDDLAVQLGIATIYLPPETDKTARPPAAAPAPEVTK